MTLAVGDRAPEFALEDQEGKLVRLSDLCARGPLVLYFYPKDHTLGCTKESCSFRDHYADFRARGAEIYGVSADGRESHELFRNNHRLPFPLLSDPGGKVAASYGVKKLLGLFPGRQTFVIDGSGTVRMKFSSALTFEEHVEKALSALSELSPAS